MPLLLSHAIFSKEFQHDMDFEDQRNLYVLKMAIYSLKEASKMV